jgi:hypothetical protein
VLQLLCTHVELITGKGNRVSAINNSIALFDSSIILEKAHNKYLAAKVGIIPESSKF